MFIAVDGIDGSGKSTLVGRIAAILAPLRPLTTKEPTDASCWGRRLRASAREGRLPRATEIEYFHKDRLHHIATVIRPALESGQIVITDRYVDSTLAFQAESVDEADRLYEGYIGTGILRPDITMILRCPVWQGRQRIQRRDKGAASTFESDAAQRRAKKIYETRSGSHYRFIDASGTEDDALRQAVSILKEHCEERRDILECLEQRL
jgi:dTMP kinase